MHFSCSFLLIFLKLTICHSFVTDPVWPNIIKFIEAGFVIFHKFPCCINCLNSSHFHVQSCKRLKLQRIGLAGVVGFLRHCALIP